MSAGCKTCGRARKRPPRPVESPDLAKAALRMLRSLGGRAGTDLDALTLLVEVRRAADDAMHQAIAAALSGERTTPYTYGDVGRVLGVSRQAARQAHERWARDNGPLS